MADSGPNVLSISQKRPNLRKQDTIDSFINEQPHFQKEIYADNDLQRQSSILSYQGLSIDGSMSVCDSQFSHYNPSINEPFVSEDADPEEKEMHAFLDAAGVFQVNIKA